MNKKILSTILLSAALLMGFFPAVTGSVPFAPPNPTEIVVATIGMPDTVDPAWSYDTASAEIIFNVYDSLIEFAGTSVDVFDPDLATEWTMSSDGLKFTFKIREGVVFQNAHILTTEDVEYSFERWMVFDRSGGPTWMIFEPLLDCFHADMSWANDTSNPINLAVESNSTHVWFNLSPVHPAYPPFMQILAQSWASIIPKDWAIGEGCWPGTWNNWTLYHDPAVSPLDDPDPVMCGSGPFEFDYWDKLTGVWSITRYVGHWEGWPTTGCKSFIDRATVMDIPEWPTRKAMFLDETATGCDFCYVPRAHRDEILAEITGGKPIRVLKDLATLGVGALFYNFMIPDNSPYCGTHEAGGAPMTNSTFAEDGIPANFFSDVDVRKAFAYCFNFSEYLATAWLDEADQPPGPHIKGLSFWEAIWEGKTLCNGTAVPPVSKYAIDLTEAADGFKRAFGGSVGTPGPVWTNGFTFTITYNTGNAARETAARILELYVESVNAKFHIEVQEVSWDTYLGDLVNYPLFKATMPLFIIGWLADYPDPHNFVFPFMHTYGDFTYFQSYSDAEVDAEIEAAIIESAPCLREIMYYDIAWKYYEKIPSLCLYQGLGRHWEKKWVQGWYDNPIYPGFYFKTLWKEDVETVNRDIGVNVYFEEEGSWTKHTTVYNIGQCYEFIDLTQKVWVDGVLVDDEYIQIWLPPGGWFKKITTIPGEGTLTWEISVEISNWYLPIEESNYENNDADENDVRAMLLGDLGSGPPPTFFAFDGSVDSWDYALWKACFDGVAPPAAMYLGDLGSGPPPAFFAFDGVVNSWDYALWKACYDGLGPS